MKTKVLPSLDRSLTRTQFSQERSRSFFSSEANPEIGVGSLHSWGVAVDATLTDACNHLVRMPTDFDELTPAAMLHYQGTDPIVRSHLALLQKAMGRSGFYGLHTEWWHFSISNWEKYVPAVEPKQVPHEVQQNDRLFSRNSAQITTP